MGIDVVYMCSWADSTRYGLLIWRYPKITDISVAEMEPGNVTLAMLSQYRFENTQVRMVSPTTVRLSKNKPETAKLVDTKRRRVP